MLKKSLAIFQNVRFNIGVFSALAIASIAGTLLPQLRESPERVQDFIARNPVSSYFFQKLDFFDLYHSWWFIGLLGLLAFDVIVCKLLFGKFPGFRTFKKSDSDRTVLLSQSMRDEWISTHTLQSCSETILSLLGEMDYSVGRESYTAGNGVALLAVKHRIQRFGSWVSHVSILIILLANLTGLLYGFKEVLNVAEGTSANLKMRPWVVFCDKFSVELYPGTDTPKTFASSLRLFDRGLLAQEKKVVVNEPMEYKQVRFYQATYSPYLKQANVGFFLKHDPKKSPPLLALHPDEDVPVPGTSYSLRILQFVPDFSMDENRKISSRSPELKNPALQILISRNGKPLRAPWIFQNYPGMQMPPVQGDDEAIPILADAVPGYYTGIQVAYDPGAGLFWSGCVVLVLGLASLFYFHHRKVWIFIEEDRPNGSVKISTGGFSSRGAQFEHEFLSLMAACREATGA